MIIPIFSRYIIRMEQREFEQIAEQLREKALQATKSYQIPEESGEDIAQDTLLKLWLRHAEFSTPEDCLRLAGHIARHLCIDHFRRQTEQKSNAEIATLLGIGKGSVATLLSKARKQIFEEIKRKERYENK